MARPVVVPLGRPAGAEPAHQPGERALAPRLHADDAEAVDEGDEIERVGRRPWAADEVLFRSSEYGGDRDSSGIGARPREPQRQQSDAVADDTIDAERARDGAQSAARRRQPPPYSRS